MSVLGPAWFLARKDVQYMLRRWETLFWTFLMPGVFFFFIGTITGGFGDTESGKDPLVLDIHPRAGYLASHLKNRLEMVGFEIRSPAQAGADSTLPRLSVPTAFTDSVLAGVQVPVFLKRKGGGLGADYDEFRVRRAVFSLLADLVAASEGEKPPSMEAMDVVTRAPRTLHLDVEQAGHRKHIPTGFEQAIPGTMVMFTLLVLLTSGSILIVIERKEKLLERLASTPLRRSTVILGKWGGRFLLGLIQIGFAMILGTVVFGMGWGPNLPMLVLVLVTYAGLVALLGMLLGSLARTEGQAIGIGVLTSNVLAALGGCWWPIEITPQWMQKFALVLPTGWAMDAMHKLVNFGAPSASVLPHLAIMVTAGLAAGWIIVRVFRFH